MPVNIAHMTRLSDVFLVATGKTDKKKKRALLLYQADPKVREMFRQIPENENDDDFDKAADS